MFVEYMNEFKFMNLDLGKSFIKYSTTIPVDAWRYKNDVFEHMTMDTWLSCRGSKSKTFSSFMNNLKLQLNNISSANRGSYSLWSVTLERHNLIISLETNNNSDMTLNDFDELIRTDLIPILRSIEGYRDTLVFNEKYYDCNTNTIGTSNMYLYNGRLVKVRQIVDQYELIFS